YMRNRSRYGINALWINPLCNHATACNSDGITYDGITPLKADSGFHLGRGGEGRKIAVYSASMGVSSLSVAVNGHPLGEIMLSAGTTGSTIVIPASLFEGRAGESDRFSVRSVDAKVGALMFGYSLRTEE